MTGRYENGLLSFSAKIKIEGEDDCTALAKSPKCYASALEINSTSTSSWLNFRMRFLVLNAQWHNAFLADHFSMK
jgi:hypothetical protein